MIKELLSKRSIPKLQTKEEMLEILQREEYGYIPKRPENIRFELIRTEKSFFCAGKAKYYVMKIITQINGKEFSFPLHCVIPTKEGKHPFFVHINFRDNVPDMYQPTEEIVDNGFAILSFCYKDVTDDNGDFTNGLAGVLYENGKRTPTDAGKIAMWAWAAQRAVDYAQTLDCLDMNCCTVCGHSRLGKTALLAAATDPRFTFAHSNDSGCSGAAITRGKGGEQVKDICTKFPYWFCENYYKYAGDADKMPFDQHFLLACIAPRFVSVSSALEDEWADPVSEFLCCVAQDGFVCPDTLPSINDRFFEGRVGYHLRAGKHYFSREDWNALMTFVKEKTK